MQSSMVRNAVRPSPGKEPNRSLRVTEPKRRRLMRNAVRPSPGKEPNRSLRVRVLVVVYEEPERWIVADSIANGAPTLATHPMDDLNCAFCAGGRVTAWEHPRLFACHLAHAALTLIRHGRNQRGGCGGCGGRCRGNAATQCQPPGQESTRCVLEHFRNLRVEVIELFFHAPHEVVDRIELVFA